MATQLQNHKNEGAIKISVIIPVYNEQDTITKCLKELTRQTVSPFEIILVDNNCTDNTIKKASKFKVKVVKETHQGISKARNKGFDNAKGDVIARIDADVNVPPKWIETLINVFSDKTIDAVAGPVYFADLPSLFSKLLPIYTNICKLFLAGNEVLLGPNMALTKKMWGKIQNSTCTDDKNIHEDIDLSMHIVFQKGQIIKNNKLCVLTSGRRIKRYPASFFIGYTIKFFKTILRHRKEIIKLFSEKINQNLQIIAY